MSVERIGLGPQASPVAPAVPARTDVAAGLGFGAILEQRLGGLRFSAHAQERLQSRGIALGDGQMQRLEQAVQKAADKGSRDSLVLLQDQAFVVSVKNRVVVTALDGDSLKNHVFTNIDSAVIG